jgi:sec-independent protein translocase protein TatC
MKMKHRQRRKNQTKKTPTPNRADVSQPFIEHLYELRRRIMYIVLSIIVFSTLAYFVQQQLVSFLLRPSKGQQFIYTSPGGGISFLFTVCTYAGIAASTPIIIYQLLGFFEPLIRNQTRRRIIKYSLYSGVMAIIGFCFGYFIGLPAALHFLSHQFSIKQIRALFTIQEYMSFLMIYLLGSVILFQLPLVLIFTNTIRPIPPRKLIKAERYVIVAAFIISMIMAPTTNLIDQLIIAGPIIFIYNLSILLIWVVNKKSRRPKNIVDLLEADRQVQEARFSKPKTFLALQDSLPETNSDNSHKMPGIQFRPNGRQAMDIQ